MDSDLKKENEVLKELVIFLAKCYQDNYDKFASTHIVAHILTHPKIDEKTREILDSVFMNFSTVQGSQYRILVERISQLKSTKNFKVTDFESVFPELKEYAQTLHSDRKEKCAEDLEDFDKTWIKTKQ